MKKSLKTYVFNSSGIDIPERCQNSKNSEAFKTKSFEDDDFYLVRNFGGISEHVGIEKFRVLSEIGNFRSHQKLEVFEAFNFNLR